MTATREPLRIAVITGGHAFDVPSFHQLFRDLPGVDSYVMTFEDYGEDVGEHRDGYDAVVLYNFQQLIPQSAELGSGRLDGLSREEIARIEGEWSLRRGVEALGSGAGILVLHHAILAFPGWDLWNDLVGIPDREFGAHMDQSLRVQVANREHPITTGLEDWDMVDESYTMASPGGDSEHLLIIDHHEFSMRTVGWTRRFRDSRVFCLQSGHGPSAYENPGLRQLVGQGIAWLAGCD